MNKALILIFMLGVFLRCLFLAQSTYFGFDEARDAFISQAIYKSHDFKLIGPPANAPGLNHGVLHWYILGLVYLLGQGNPLAASIFFRLANALGIILIFLVAKKLFNTKIGLISAFLFAISFEQTQYAMYMGNPSLAIISWMSIFLGISMILKSQNKFWGLPLMALGVATAVQFELFLITLVGVAGLSLALVKSQLRKISLSSFLLALVIGMVVLGTYFVSEAMYNFRTVKTGYNLILQGNDIIGDSETRWSVYFKRLALLFHDNILPTNQTLSLGIIAGLVLFLLIKSRREIAPRIVIVWMLGGLIVLSIGAYNAYYINVGVGPGLLIAVSVFLYTIFERNKPLSILILCLIIISNLAQILQKNPQGLIGDIKTQQYMTLSDQIKIIDWMYQQANGKAFTIRGTTMPYKISTVWAYLLKFYGQNKYNYLPYWETGTVAGYPGTLPQPQSGSTCVRYWLQEPTEGIPGRLTQEDLIQENYFSKIMSEWKIGHFVIQKRLSLDPNCHNISPKL